MISKCKPKIKKIFKQSRTKKKKLVFFDSSLVSSSSPRFISLVALESVRLFSLRANFPEANMVPRALPPRLPLDNTRRRSPSLQRHAVELTEIFPLQKSLLSRANLPPNTFDQRSVVLRRRRRQQVIRHLDNFRVVVQLLRRRDRLGLGQTVLGCEERRIKGSAGLRGERELTLLRSAGLKGERESYRGRREKIWVTSPQPKTPVCQTCLAHHRKISPCNSP